MNHKDFLNGIFGSKVLEYEIKNLVDYMNIHLMQLSLAMQEGNQSAIEFQKSKLQEIRTRLMVLEYFPFKASNTTNPNS